MYFMFFTHTVILIDLYKKYISRLISAILGNVLFKNSRTFQRFLSQFKGFSILYEPVSINAHVYLLLHRDCLSYDKYLLQALLSVKSSGETY